MASILELEPTEKGTLVVHVSWLDEAGNAVQPTAATWSLSDMAGGEVNGRTGVDFYEALSTTNNIVLTGADLAVLPGAPDNRRVVTVEATYTSATYGPGLNLRAAVIFTLEDLVAVS